MPEPDATAAASLVGAVQRPAFFAFLDIDGLPQRVTTAGYDVAFEGTGDPDLDGFTFEAVNPQFVEIGEVKQGVNGSETMTCALSGVIELDADVIATLEDRTLWQGRIGRFWKMERDADGAPVGAIYPYHTGWMSAPEHDLEASRIELQLEGYLAAVTGEPSNRSYSGQASFDPDDMSAAASLACANGVGAGPGGTVGAIGSLGGARFHYDEPMGPG